MPDEFFENPRSARVYDLVDGERDDLDLYEQILDEFGCTSVLDVGSGTGVLGRRLAERGLRVHGIDPAQGMTEVARSQPSVAGLTIQRGVVVDVDPALRFDAATMTGNVAMVFLTDDDWLATLAAIRERLNPAGLLIFETRDPSKRAWEGWTRGRTTQVVEHESEGRLEDWVDVTAVELPFVTFDGVVTFLEDDTEVRSTSTLRFRERQEVDASLDHAGFDVVDVRDAPDRPGLEFVYIARRRP